MSSPSRLTRRGVLLAGAALLTGCATPTASRPQGSGTPAGVAAESPLPTPEPTPTPGAASVPVLCYHQVRDWASGDSSYTRQLLVCPPKNFRAQLDALGEAGYTTITPDAYLTHLRTGAGLPDKPVLLSFDDGKDNQALVAGPELDRRGMVGTFFVMTVVIGNAGWISATQIKDLAEAGHTIGSHTWDHHAVTSYAGEDWRTQLDGSREKLRSLSGQEVTTFAYPYGAWNAAALPHLREAGYTTAFQLQEKPLDAEEPALTLRRILANSTWSGAQTIKAVTKAP